MSVVLKTVAESIAAIPAKPKRKGGHTKPCAPDPRLLEIDTARLRVSHILSLLSIGHNAFYRRLNKGQFPACDGRDGRHQYWHVRTVREYMAKK